MTREDAIALVTKLVATTRPDEEHERIKMMDRLELCFPNADIIDLIYQDMRNLTPGHVVDEAYQREEEHARSSATEVKPCA